MSENILDIGKWKEMVCLYNCFFITYFIDILLNYIYSFIHKYMVLYPFLNNVLTIYGEFDNPVEGDTNQNDYDVLCDQIVRTSNADLGKHKNVCMKLMRNLGHRSINSNFLYPKQERCNVLYNWIYNSIKKHSIPWNVIIKCYEDYTTLKNVMNNKYICPYYSYDDTYEEPINIIMLQIFESSMDIIKDNFIDKNNSINLRCKSYVCELVNLYNIMNSRYCLNLDENDIKRKSTCDILKNFKTAYMLFLFGDKNLNDNIPSLDNVEKEYTKKCLPSKPEVPSNAPRDNDVLELPSLPVDSGEKINVFPFPSPLNGEKPGSSTSSTVSTAIGTLAGASSILALLYKVTQNFI
ncbi:hypothetical protein PVBG_04798 [Plasmodium vivax Brazil I]|uniref:Uncharacterized protein n=1 Tax=Plasmodium vivax (strain Brazil I) TaxID=1033975 RepID=A0A0J9T0D7_PLAV1|nr:hypothetical protein PVBG_04798 [Plasmodium vivax Brazil I]